MPPPGSRPNDANTLRGKRLPPVPGADQHGQAIVWDDPADAYAFAPMGEGGGGGPVPLAGDVEGTTAAATVTRIRGRNVPAPAAAGGDEGKAVVVSGSAYGYQALPVVPPPVTEVAMGGDVTGSSAAAVVERLRGKPVDSPDAADDQKYLKYVHPTGYVHETPAAPQGAKVADLAVTATGAAAAAVTATLPAVAGQFHYISAIVITKYVTAAITGTATPILVTTTNLPGNLVFTLARAGAIGTREVEQVPLPIELKSAAAGVPTTIVCPGTTSIIWRVTVIYRVGA